MHPAGVGAASVKVVQVDKETVACIKMLESIALERYEHWLHITKALLIIE